MHQCLVISAIAEDHPDLLRDLSRAILDSGCSIQDSRMTLLGAEFAILLLISGHWSTIAKLEAMLPALRQRLALNILSKRTQLSPPTDSKFIPYAIETISLDQPNIIYELVCFFSSHNISLKEMNVHHYLAPYTGVPLFSVNIIIHLPINLSIVTLREQFMELCDSLNLDAVLEPVRGH